MSGGGTESSGKVNYPKWLKPHVLYGVEQARSLYDRPETPPSLYPGMDPSRSTFLSGAGQRDIIDPSVAEFGRTMRGEYLNGSPYLDEIIRRSQQDAQSNIGAQYGGSGRFGGGQWAASLADASQGISADLRNQNYQAERDRMGGYLGMAPVALGTGEYAGRAREEDTALQQEEAYRQFQWPTEKLNQMMQILYGNPSSRAITTTTTKDINWLDIVGGILTGPGGGM
jgi:hypothetical protein